jgi:dihydrofolate reductase
MGKIIAGLFITLDGVVEAPGPGDTTLPEKRGWSMPFMNEQIGMEIMRDMDSSAGLLLGRKTYDGFAAFWPNIGDDDPFGKRMNGQRKYVVSTTLTKADWNNSVVVNGKNFVEEISKLKQQSNGNLNMTGSGTLVASLIEHDLLDELQLLVCPVILGTGRRLFNEGATTKTLTPVDARKFDSGMTLLTFRPASA